MTAYDTNNIFAKILRSELPCHKLYEDDETFVMMDIMPRGNGHCLILPKKPFRNILDVDEKTLGAVYATVAKMSKTVMKAFGADGVTVQQFNEPAGGQVVFHMHVHVIPRFDGVAMRSHTGEMEDEGVLTANAEKIRAHL